MKLSPDDILAIARALADELEARHLLGPKPANDVASDDTELRNRAKMIAAKVKRGRTRTGT